MGLLASALPASAPAGGPVWPVLDPAIWEFKSAGLPGQPDAMILVDRYHFHRRTLERFRRVL